MNDSIDSENKKQARHKPPLSVGRIVGEIMFGKNRVWKPATLLNT